MRVSFVIPALNEERHLPRCLRSVAAMDRPPGVEVEVIVVDNKSTDRTPELAREAGATVVTVEPGRISRTRNTGAKAAAGDLLAFVDADVELSPDWLTRCTAHFADPGVVGVAAGMRPPAAGLPWVETGWYELAHRERGATPRRADWLPTYNVLVRRADFEALGGFDESLVTCEDSDLGYRLAARGTLLVDPAPWFVHHGESKTLRQFFRREAWRSRGNLQSALNHRFVPGELPSLVVPPAFLLAWVVGLVLLAAGLATGVVPLTWAGGALVLAAALLPVAGVLRRGVTPVRPVVFARCYFLLSVYLLARAVGSVLPLARVTR